MGFCESTVKDGIFILTLGGSDDGQNYLTVQSLMDLEEELKDIRTNRVRSTSKGLVTTSKGELFCNGGDYGETDELAHLMARVVHEIFNMPFPTVAAVTGDVRSSLALALVLAHDDTATMEKAKFEVKEVRDGRACMPPYVAALLRDKAAFPRMRSSMVLRSETMLGSDMTYWEVFERWIYEKEGGGVDIASGIITGSFGDVHDGRAYITTRKSFFPESWKAVSDFLGDDQ
jgi:enoyl-CoA hydratase/carnithine racemase